MTTDPFAQFKKTYFEECADLLGQAEPMLAGLDVTAPDIEQQNAIFRAVHSIKGGAATFGFERLIKFTHEFETVLDKLRSGQLSLNAERHQLFMRSLDMVADLVAAARDKADLPAAREADLLAQLMTLLGAPTPTTAVVAPAAEQRHVAGATAYQIKFTPHADMLRKANEPLLLIRELASLGALTTTLTVPALPSLAEYNPEDSYLSWQFVVHTKKDEAKIREVFEFVTDDCALVIEPLAEAETAAATAAEAPQLANNTPASSSGAATAATATQPTSIRVDLDKINKLVNMVGEIVITQAMISQQLAEANVAGLENLLGGLDTMSLHTRELQDSVMAIRAQPVKSVFQRMPRLVRELSADLGKQIKLEMIGEHTEVDKTVIEQLADPLTHMIRNSLDHGIEKPDERLAKGKPAQGTIMLSAQHRSGRILIEVQDDGAGINRDKVKEKALKLGLVNPQQNLSDEDIDQLIFAPGFSTAEVVSSVSGRGVGMDVVRKNIQAMGGRVFVASTPGQGTRITLSLPLTLAVLDGMVVAVGGERYVLPLTSILESLRPHAEQVAHLPQRGDVINIRGEYIPLAYLGKIFAVPNAQIDPTKALVVLVEGDGGMRLGLVVDEIIGQQQVVIKSLETNYQPIDGISAATILGDGRVALILDIVGLQSITSHGSSNHSSRLKGAA